MKAIAEILNRTIMVDGRADAPLHTQLRRSLRTIIDRHFADGERFFSEAELIAHLQLSQSTVRRALTDLASEGLIERRVAKGSFVRKVPAETHTRSVGVFVPAFASEFWSRVIEETSRSCRQMYAGMSVYHTERGERLADAFRCLVNPPTQERVVVLGLHESDELLRALDDRGYRVVMVDIPAGSERSFVGVDNAKGIALGVEHLFDLGHRDIALVVNEAIDGPSAVARIDAYRLCMAQRGLRSRVIDCGCRRGDDSVKSAYRTMGQVFELSPRPTALFAISDNGALGILRWCSEKGIRVPGDVSVMGFGDDRPASFVQPTLSTVAQPIQAIAEMAMQVLWDDSTETRRELLAPTLVVRESTAAPYLSPSVAVSQHVGLVTT